jgi:hypothetical protein
MMRGLFVGALLAGVSVQALACDQNSLYTTRQADVTCYGTQPDTSNDAAPAIMAAWRDAVRLGVPLSFPGGRYHVASTLDFDYAAAASQGVEIQGNGSIIEGAAGVTPLYVHCSGGNPNSPKACFYLHLAGTLHIYADSSWWGAIIGDWTYADAHNSMKIDHLDVNNSGSGGGAILSGVYNGDVYIVANANGYFGLQLNRVQFSVFRGAMGAVGGNALPFCRAIASELVGDHDAGRPHLLLQQFAKQPLGRLFVASALNQNIEHRPGLVLGAPQPALYTGDLQ